MTAECKCSEMVQNIYNIVVLSLVIYSWKLTFLGCLNQQIIRANIDPDGRGTLLLPLINFKLGMH